MARFKLLLITALTAALAVTPAPTVAGETNPVCSPAEAVLGTCPTVGGEIVGGGVQLGAGTTVPGRGSGSGSNGDRNGTGGGNRGGGGAGSVTSPGNAPSQDAPGWDNYTVTGPIRLSDLVNFRPAPGVDSMEPDGWMIVGLETNFYATAPVQVQSGTLLDLPAQVRFTPVRYHWKYGDGTTRSASTPGATWAAQGLSEFDRTPTSHVYTASGTYYIDLTIDFAAEYRWASGDWTRISGTIPVPANRLVATAGGAKTVLVEHECTLNPRGPGC